MCFGERGRGRYETGIIQGLGRERGREEGVTYRLAGPSPGWLPLCALGDKHNLHLAIQEFRPVDNYQVLYSAPTVSNPSHPPKTGIAKGWPYQKAASRGDRQFF